MALEKNEDKGDTEEKRERKEKNPDERERGAAKEFNI